MEGTYLRQLEQRKSNSHSKSHLFLSYLPLSVWCDQTLVEEKKSHWNEGKHRFLSIVCEIYTCIKQSNTSLVFEEDLERDIILLLSKYPFVVIFMYILKNKVKTHNLKPTSFTLSIIALQIYREILKKYRKTAKGNNSEKKKKFNNLRNP